MCPVIDLWHPLFLQYFLQSLFVVGQDMDLFVLCIIGFENTLVHENRRVDEFPIECIWDTPND